MLPVLEKRGNFNLIEFPILSRVYSKAPVEIFPTCEKCTQIPLRHQKPIIPGDHKLNYAPWRQIIDGWRYNMYIFWT